MVRGKWLVVSDEFPDAWKKFRIRYTNRTSLQISQRRKERVHFVETTSPQREALIREAEHAETKKDFIHKMSIAQKEINETSYWLHLLYETDYLTKTEFESIYNDAIELIRLLTSIIKTAKQNLANH